MADFASINDIITLGRPLTRAETDKATALLPIASAAMREAAISVSRDLDAMISADQNLAEIAKQVCVDVVLRALKRNTDESGGYTQMTQTAGSYSMTVSPLVSGRSIFLMKNEMSALGLRRQRIGVIDIYGTDSN